MSKMEIATAFFHACEGLQGSEGCAQYLAEGAGFASHNQALADIDTAAGYCDWMAGAGKGPLVGCSYEIHAASFDDSQNIALFFATFTGKHTGEGGPVDPTGKTTHSHYVYAVTVNDDNKVSHLTKIWNAPWAFRELGWG
jgi:hypothetical protein